MKILKFSVVKFRTNYQTNWEQIKFQFSAEISIQIYLEDQSLENLVNLKLTIFQFTRSYYSHFIIIRQKFPSWSGSLIIQQLDILSISAQYNHSVLKHEVLEIQQMISEDKAIFNDCVTHQFIKHCNWLILSDIWNENTIILNKKKDGPGQFLLIFSSLLKFMDLRFYNKLAYFLQNCFLKKQIGFVKIYGTQINILISFDKIKNIQGKEKYMIIFVDFSNAYNTIERTKLYKILEQQEILNSQEIEFQMTLHSRVLLINPYNQNEQIHYQNGVHQGSPTSPYLFNIYMDQFLKEFIKQISCEIKILGYADDLALLIKQKNCCYEFISKLLNLAQEWKLFLNHKKFGIMPIKFTTSVQNILNIPIVRDYNYLGKLYSFQICFQINGFQIQTSFISNLRRNFFNYNIIAIQFQNKTQYQKLLKQRRQLFTQVLRLPKNTPDQFLNSISINFIMKIQLNKQNLYQSALQISDFIKKLQENQTSLNQIKHFRNLKYLPQN